MTPAEYRDDLPPALGPGRTGKLGLGLGVESGSELGRRDIADRGVCERAQGMFPLDVHLCRRPSSPTNASCVPPCRSCVISRHRTSAAGPRRASYSGRRVPAAAGRGGAARHLRLDAGSAVDGVRCRCRLRGSGSAQPELASNDDDVIGALAPLRRHHLCHRPRQPAPGREAGERPGRDDPMGQAGPGRRRLRDLTALQRLARTQHSAPGLGAARLPSAPHVVGAAHRGRAQRVHEQRR